MHMRMEMGLFMDQSANHVVDLERSYKRDWKSRLSHFGWHLIYDLSRERHNRE